MKRLLPILTAIVGCILTSSCTRYDEHDLIARFEANKIAFSRLGSLSLEDTWLRNLTRDKVYPAETRLSEARLIEYRRLFAELEIKNGLLRRYGHEGIVFFGVGSYGLPSGGASHGYAFSPSGKVGREVEKIEPNAISKLGTVYQRIGDGWYIYFRQEG